MSSKRSVFKNFNFMVISTAALDFLCLQAALLIGFWLWIEFPWHGNYQYFSDYVRILWIVPPLGVVVFQSIGLYKPEMGVMGVAEQSLVFKGIWIVYFIAFAVSFFYRGGTFSRLAVFYSVFIAIFLISIERFLMRNLYAWLHRKGIAVRKALIYGAGYHGQRLERWIHQSPKLGIQVVGYLDDNIEVLVKKPVSPPCLGTLQDLKRIVAERNISMLFIAHRSLKEVEVLQIFQMCREIHVPCWAIPSLYQFYIERIRITNIGGIPLVGFKEEFNFKFYVIVKRVLDILFALLLLPVLIPVGILISAGILLTSGAPVFFKQPRAGAGGKKFTMYKFRTLKTSTRRDDVSPELQKEGVPSAVTPLGDLLRRTGFDELPQILNVLKGEMSFIGPRPEMLFIVEKYSPLERERLRLRPGITGLWQISEDRKRIFIHENMDYDLYYAEHLSFNLDLAIMLKTVVAVLKGFLPRRVPVPAEN